ncbi:MAG: ABC transporter substrate-binding protein [Bdellovibrionales bacterium]|nr:ABC transporter substrate-binding protein [Bdellovibrionales bacterium]
MVKWCKHSLVAIVVAGGFCLVWGISRYGLPKEKIILRIPMPITDLVLDPHKMHDASSMFVSLQLHRGLLRYLPDGRIVTDIAESWTESADKQIYRFTLKRAKFSSGKLITAEIIRLSLARIFWLKASIGADLNYIEGIDNFLTTGKIENLGINAVSDEVLEVRLARPVALFLKHLATADCAILDVKSHRDDYNPSSEKVGFSGPYKVMSWTDKGIILTKWRTDSVDSSRPPRNVQFLKYNPADIFRSAQSGNLDVADDIPLPIEERKALEAKGWRQTVAELSRERFLIVNPKQVSREIRAYLFSQYDTDQLIREVNEPLYKSAYGLIPNGIQGGLSKEDLLEVKQAIEYSAHPRGEVELMYSQEYSQNLPLVQAMKRQWDRPGFEIKLRGVQTEELIENMVNGKGQLIFGAKGTDYPDGIAVLNYFKSGYEPNFFHMQPSQLDQKIEDLNTIFDPEKRIQAYREIQKEIFKNLTVIPVFFGSLHVGLWAPKVNFVPPHPMGLHTLPLEMIEMAQ